MGVNTLVSRIWNVSKRVLPIVVCLLGILLLLGIWTVLYEAEALFTESHLVGYNCCVYEEDWASVSTLERASSDFFRAAPGKYLPPVLFLAVNFSLFASGMWKARGRAWLPLLFVLFSGLYLVVDFWLVGVTWSISERIAGPITGIYKGYDHTWYGIVGHLLLWGALFFALARSNGIATARTRDHSMNHPTCVLHTARAE